MTSLVDDLLMAATDCEGNRYGDLLTKAAATVEELEDVKAELLGVLEELTDPLLAHLDGDDTPDMTADEFDAWIQQWASKARAAIAKAKGE